ncbi:MAG: non-canonical purine NTP pyrophosphatase [Actinomycetota bacterium]|nr:MAG: non-canonical purine NTP pyrophosphatase [Actinomycetota bacterium]
MAIPATIAIATRNPHKLRELERICADWPVTWVTVRTHDPAAFPAVAETEATYLGNARLKAHATARALGLPALADDSGIEVDALGGGPGPRSARFAGEGASDEANLRALLQAVRGVPSAGRTARYRCVALLAFPDGGERWAEGVCEGVLRRAPVGSGGFGYDPIFEPAGWERTMAELAPEEKDRISHRGRAFRALRELLV